MRQLKDGWIETYKNYIIRQESPDAFHLWVAMQMIAVTLKRNIFVDRNTYRVYPNQYVFLIGESGSCKKSGAMEIGLDLLQEIKEVNIIHERTTVEGLMDLMSRVVVNTETNKVTNDGSVLIHADELSNLFGRASYITDLVSFLTAAYTSRAKLEFLTRNKGACSIKNPCPSILAGTTPDSMGQIFPSATVRSGFMARVMLILGSRGRRVADPMLDKSLQPSLVHDLHEISMLRGEIRLCDEANALFKSWYEAAPPPKYSELFPFYERKHDHVLKAAMVFSVSESNSMIITTKHLTRAINAVEYIEALIPHALTYIGATTQSNVADVIEGFVRSRSPLPVKHSELLRKVYRLVKDGNEFKAIIETLVEAGRLETVTEKAAMYYVINTKRGK